MRSSHVETNVYDTRPLRRIYTYVPLIRLNVSIDNRCMRGICSQHIIYVMKKKEKHDKRIQVSEKKTKVKHDYPIKDHRRKNK